MLRAKTHVFVPLLAIFAILAGCSTQGSEPSNRIATPAPATTRRITVVDDYGGFKIADPYRWLEDVDSDRTKAWVEAQNRVTEAFLAKVEERPRIRQRLEQLWSYERFGPPFLEGETWYYFHNNGLQNQSVMYRATAPRQQGAVFLDPNKLSADGTVALGGMSFSKDGRYLAYSYSTSGSDWREWKVMDTRSGETLADHLTWTKFTGATWDKDGKGFFYQRYPKPVEGQTYEQVNQSSSLRYHKLGTAESADPVIYSRPDQPSWGFASTLGDGGRYLVVSISSGTDPRRRVAYLDLSHDNPGHDNPGHDNPGHDNPSHNPKVQPLLMAFDAGYYFLGNNDKTFFFLTDKDAPRRRVITVSLDAPTPDKWHEVVPQTTDTLESADILGERLVLVYLQDAHHRVVTCSLDGKDTKEVKLPGLGSVGGFTGKREQPLAFFTFSSFTQPASVYQLDPRSGAVELVRQPKVDFDPARYETRQVFFESKDGTRVPMFIVHRKGLVLNGNSPTYLYGYGGFNIALKPRFSVRTVAWLEMGGIYAQPTLRGGGEYGSEWHEAGMLEKKQNVFDDFIAAAEYLVRNGFTRREKLAIGGGSNGGLLVGAVLTQRPELFGAAIPEVGVLDMLRYHKFTIGHAWAPEYGRSDDPKMFKTLLAYSPLHNVKNHDFYPATLVMTGDHDDRVLPGHSYKFAAALQAQQQGSAPILIRIETKTGHGAGKPISKVIAEAADRWAFLARVLEMRF
jgi:prolyl oligopeptidase